MSSKHSPVRIAIVGGGVSGLSLAKFLRDVDDTRATFHVSIFDTGERACGGRSSSKALEGVDVDHGLQYFTLASDVARESFARPLVECGALAEWSAAAVGALREGEFRAFDDDVARYVGVGGFRAMSEALESNADEVRRPQWVGAMSPSRFDDDGRATAWTLATNASDRAKRLGEYDFVVIAHNGKCAHRLASTAKGLDGRGACDKVTNALRCGFGVKPRADMERENKLLLSSVWSVMVAFDGALEFGFEGAHVIDGEPLSWVSNISAKRGGDFADGRTRVVLQSTAEYARDNKVPQEAVPKEKSAEVVDTLVAALERALARPAGSLRGKVTSYKTQLWGAANPLNCANVSCVLDLDSSVAAIGDWCTDGPACVEAAVIGIPHDIKGQGIFAYCILKEGVAETDDLVPGLKNAVRQAIGGLASPDYIVCTPGLPKTRSGKIMRRVLRKIACRESDQLGDTSTLADPSIVTLLIEKVEKLYNKK